MRGGGRSSSGAADPPPTTMAEDGPRGKRRRRDDDDDDDTDDIDDDNAKPAKGAAADGGEATHVTSTENDDDDKMRAAKAVKFHDTGEEAEAVVAAEDPKGKDAETDDREGVAAAADAAEPPREATPEQPVKRKRGRPPKKKKGPPGAAGGAGGKTPGTDTKTPKAPKAPRPIEPTPGTRERLPRAAREIGVVSWTPGGGGESSAAAKLRLRSQEKPKHKPAPGADGGAAAGDDDEEAEKAIDVEMIDMNKRVLLPEGWVPPAPVRHAPSYPVSVELQSFVHRWKLQRKNRRKVPIGGGVGGGVSGDVSGGGDMGGVDGDTSGGGGGEPSQALQLHRASLQPPGLPPPPRGEDLELLAGAAAGPYSTMRALSRTLKLSPFTLDSLVAALARSTPSALVDDVHVAVLAALYSDEVEGNTILPGPASSAPGVGAAAAPAVVLSGAGEDDAEKKPEDPRPEARDTAKYLDAVTWPDYLAALLARTRAKRGVRHLPAVNPREYYTLPSSDKVALLTYLCDELLQTAAVRNELDTREGLDLDGGLEDEDWEGGGGGGGGGRAGAPGAAAAGPTGRVGVAVEVFGVEEGLQGSWYSAVVVAATANRIRVRYDELLQDESAHKLEEWVELEDVHCDDTAKPRGRRKKALPTSADIGGGGGGGGGGGDDDDDGDDDDGGDEDWRVKNATPKAGRRYLTFPRVRPLPPAEMIRDRVAAKRTTGDRVEVWTADGWWYGRVLEPAGPGGRVTVYFPGEGDSRTAPRKDVRTALTWEGAGADGGWYLSGTDDAVDIAGGEQDKEEEQEQEEDGDGEEGEEDVRNVDMCMVCGRPGSLICCDGCPNAYHMPCVGETRASLPDDDWYCPECVALPQGLRVRIRGSPSHRCLPVLVLFSFFFFLLSFLFPSLPLSPPLPKIPSGSPASISCSFCSLFFCPLESHVAARNPLTRRRSIFLITIHGGGQHNSSLKNTRDYR